MIVGSFAFFFLVIHCWLAFSLAGQMDVQCSALLADFDTNAAAVGHNTEVLEGGRIWVGWG